MPNGKVWTVVPGGVSALCEVYTPEGVRHNFICINETTVEVGLHDSPKFETFPLEIRAAVNKHFGTVFALPIGKRGDYLRSCVPEQITVGEPS